MSIESSDRFLITYQGDHGFLINPTDNMDQGTEKILRDLPAFPTDQLRLKEIAARLPQAYLIK